MKYVCFVSRDMTKHGILTQIPAPRFSPQVCHRFFMARKTSQLEQHQRKTTKTTSRNEKSKRDFPNIAILKRTKLTCPYFPIVPPTFFLFLISHPHLYGKLLLNTIAFNLCLRTKNQTSMLETTVWSFDIFQSGYAQKPLLTYAPILHGRLVII